MNADRIRTTAVTGRFARIPSEVTGAAVQEAIIQKTGDVLVRFFEPFLSCIVKIIPLALCSDCFYREMRELSSEHL